MQLPYQPGPPHPQSDLSVSSVGSEAMQHPMCIQYCSQSRRTFSILGRIGGDATVGVGPGVGVGGTFQYPRSDRRRCNNPAAVPPPGSGSTFSILGRIGGDATTPPFIAPPVLLPLSVSSVGSEAMQPGDAGHHLPLQPGPFSILGRIGGDATCSDAGRSGRSVCPFQYPRSDRRRCNAPLAPDDQREKASFQYPRSDRRRCNWPVTGRRITTFPTFSILGRIGGDATPERRPPPPPAPALSVSSVGSEAMQHPQMSSAIFTMYSFSILGRIGGDATKGSHWKN